MHAFFAARWAKLVAILGLASLPLWCGERSLAADPSELKYPEAASAVREALQREIYGSASLRRELLDEALAQAPEYPPHAGNWVM